MFMWYWQQSTEAQTQDAYIMFCIKDKASDYNLLKKINYLPQNKQREDLVNQELHKIKVQEFHSRYATYFPTGAPLYEKLNLWLRWSFPTHWDFENSIEFNSRCWETSRQAKRDRIFSFLLKIVLYPCHSVEDYEWTSCYFKTKLFYLGIWNNIGTCVKYQ